MITVVRVRIVDSHRVAELSDGRFLTTRIIAPSHGYGWETCVYFCDKHGDRGDSYHHVVELDGWLPATALEKAVRFLNR